MKSPIPILLTAILLANIASAQYANSIRKANEVSGKMTAQQNAAAAEGTPPPGPSPYDRYGKRPGQPPGAPVPGAPPAEQPAAPVAPVAPVKPSAQQLAATKLKTDIAEARGKSEVSADMKKQFEKDLAAVAQGRVRPSPGSVGRFGESLLAALAGKTATAVDDAKLVKAIVVSFNSAGLPASRTQEINNEVRTLLTKSGASAADASVVGENLSAVVSDLQSSAPN